MEFKTAQILKILEINRNTFQDWFDNGCIVPSIKKSTKKGNTKLYSFSDICLIAIFKQLINAGFCRDVADKMVNGYSEGSDSLLKESIRQLLESFKKNPDFVKFFIVKRWVGADSFDNVELSIISGKNPDDYGGMDDLFHPPIVQTGQDEFDVDWEKGKPVDVYILDISSIIKKITNNIILQDIPR